MRRLITLDPDVDGAIHRFMRERGLTFREAVNTAIRRGLSGPNHRDTDHTESFAFPTHSMGGAKVSLDKALEVASEMEDDDFGRSPGIK